MSLVLKIPAVSREYVWVRVVATGDDAAHLTDLPVEMAFVADDADPTEDQWQPAEWSGSSARCLVGPSGGLTLSPEDYMVWVRVTGATERPARPVGRLRIT